MRPLIILLLFLCAVPLIHAENAELDIFARKLESLAENQTLRAEYRQIRHFREMDFSMEINGFMLLEQNKRLLWRTKSPMDSAVLIDQESLQTWDEETNKVTRLSAADFPWLRSLFKTQNLWINGDLRELQKNFTVKIADERTLVLTPSGTDPVMFFQQIRIRFRTDFSAVEEAGFLEKNGDTMTLIFTKVESNKEIPENEWKLPPQ